MALPITPKTMPALTEQIGRLRLQTREDMRSHIRSRRENLKNDIAQLESNRLAIVLLSEAGFVLETNSYGEPGEWVYIRLGQAHKNKAERARVEAAKKSIASILACHLEEHAKEVVNGRSREVNISLRPSKFHGVRIEYLDKLPKDAVGVKCKIVKERRRSSSYTSYSLQCEI